jgi:hypothetical protein
MLSRLAMSASAVGPARVSWRRAAAETGSLGGGAGLLALVP